MNHKTNYIKHPPADLHLLEKDHRLERVRPYHSSNCSPAGGPPLSALKSLLCAASTAPRAKRSIRLTAKDQLLRSEKIHRFQIC